MEKVLYRMSHGLGRPEDLDLISTFGDNIVARRGQRPVRADHDLPLGPSVVSPIASLDKYFRDEIEARMARADRGWPTPSAPGEGA